MMRTEGSSSQAAGTMTSNAITTSVAEKAGNAASAGDNRAYSNGGSRKNKCSSSKKSGAGTRNRAAEKGPLCYGNG